MARPPARRPDWRTRFVTDIPAAVALFDQELRYLAASAAWIDALESEAAGVASMSAGDTNRLHARASNPPAIITEPHAKRLNKVVKDLESRLEELAVEWLIEKYRALPELAKKKFLRLVTEMVMGI